MARPLKVIVHSSIQTAHVSVIFAPHWDFHFKHSSDAEYGRPHGPPHVRCTQGWCARSLGNYIKLIYRVPITIENYPAILCSRVFTCSIKRQARIMTYDYLPMPVLRRPSKYSVQERAILNTHKDNYKKQTTPAGRMHVAQTDILPAIFNYWSSQGVEFSDGEIEGRTKVNHCFPVGCAIGLTGTVGTHCLDA